MKESMLGDFKGISPSSEPANNISLKPVPPAGGLARSQLDCIARNKPGESWEKHAADCTPVTPNVPEPPTPTRVDVPTDPALLAKFLASIGQLISTSRESLVKQDQEISVQEHTIAQEELKVADPAKPKAESDALRRAREALAKAKADRARTATELARLEQQEQAARQKAAPDAQ
jgi:cell division protein FtsN